VVLALIHFLSPSNEEINEENEENEENKKINKK